MPEISKINIDNNTYDLKVMTKNVAPIIVKNYTGVYCTANNDPNGYLYFARLKPENNDWSKQIHIKFRIKADIPHLTNGSGYEESVVDYCLYNSTVLWYRALNGQSNTSYRPFYEHIVYRALQAGIQGGFGHLLGLRFYSSYSPNSSTYARSILIEILELDNCTIEFLDSMTIYSSVPGNGSTNYAGRNGFNATSQGVTRTGDANFSKVLTVNVGSVPTLPCSISDANVTENMVVLNSYLSNPGSQLDDWTITTGNGSINISGTIRGSTNIILTLIEEQRS